MEAKNGLKGSGDPAYQGAGYYSKFWLSRLDQPAGCERLREVFNGTCCPTLLIEVLGAHLRISSLAWLGRITLCPMTPLLNTLWLEDDPQVRSLACSLRALKEALAVLRTFYSNVPATQLQVRKPGLLLGQPYPLLDQYENARVLGRGGRLVYEAMRSADGVRVVVKFARSYGVEAHRAWADHVLAPKVFRHEALPGGYHMVEMELLDEADGWMPLSAVGAAVYDSVEEEALQRLTAAHTSSKPTFVHGDMRPANCMVRHRPARDGDGSSSSDGSSGDWDVRFLDFEFAGVEGEGVYPSPLNPNVVWAAGAEYGQPLQRSHDVHLLKQRDSSTSPLLACSFSKHSIKAAGAYEEHGGSSKGGGKVGRRF
ncbi:hypothetical protein TSOC_014332 [Tetrabaena socialis]|uniref:Protein kinase domain-containing protein n=1 Tax=Tetrabaena socialis TaxID=47790 RepID=A0A2J7ZHY3_9CHLO|nr:hypothetical protein TSOC_014332 [Tetrabaena socialis]|eukprot:PNG99878.1 hypothetical protein TSOC_014332 [Tetrabaena socialis]